jgi:3-oxoacyl-[acyl-carrier protein] reductase
MDLELADKAALIIGGSSGLGLASARAIAGEGARVAICARRSERLEAASKGTGGTWFPCDTAVPGQAAGAIAAAMAHFGRLDILVVSGGGPPAGDLDDVSTRAWTDAYQALWLSTVEAITAVLPGMRGQGWGRIVIVSSVAAKEPVPSLILSNSLRAGLLGFVNSMGASLAPSGITINAILPGYFDTPRIAQLAEPRSEILAKIPAGRCGAPAEFGSLAAFLASERAGYLTGQGIGLDGGLMRGI